MDEVLLTNTDKTIASDFRERELSAFTQTMDKFRVNRDQYSILAPADERVCLSYEDDSWVTYVIERGEKRGERQFAAINDALRDMIWRLSQNSYQSKMMVEYYNGLIKTELREENV